MEQKNRIIKTRKLIHMTGNSAVALLLLSLIVTAIIKLELSIIISAILIIAATVLAWLFALEISPRIFCGLWDRIADRFIKSRD